MISHLFDIYVGLLHVSSHVACIGRSDLIGIVRHQGTSLKWILIEHNSLGCITKWIAKESCLLKRADLKLQSECSSFIIFVVTECRYS